MEAKCRLCLSTAELQNIFPGRNGLPTVEEIQQATSIKILDTSSFSKWVCSNCILAVRSANQLKTTALESDRWWRSTSCGAQDDFNYFHSKSTLAFTAPAIQQRSSNIRKLSISDIAKLRALAKNSTKKPEPEPLKPLLPASVFKKITITPLFSSKLWHTKRAIDTSQAVSNNPPPRKVQIQSIIKIRPPFKRSATRYHLVCEICGKISKNRDRFNEHRNCHFNTKPFRCSQCPLRFNARNSHKRHMRVHQNIKPFVCKLCSKTYSALHHLKAHMSEKHSTDEERVHHCNICKKSFLFKFLLTAHLKNHLTARKSVKSSLNE